MQHIAHLEVGLRRCMKRLDRFRLPGLFVVSIIILACLIWMHPQKANAPLPWRAPSDTQSTLSGSGQGAGGSATTLRLPASPALCNPFDPTCIANSVASWAASQIQAAFQPITDEILKNPADIIFQTPLLTDETSPQNKAIITLNTFFVEVVDLAFACLLVVAGYNAIVGRHLNLPHSSILEALPRAVLVVAAVHFNLLFVGLFVSFENALTLAVFHVAGLHMLTNLISGLFTGQPSGLIAFLLLVVLAIMTIMLLIQMVTRIALVAISLTFTPLGLGCFFLPQTMRWGRLWLVTLSTSVLVQFIQVTALGLGGMFISAIAATSFGRIDVQLATAFLAIGTMGLVLKIPGMLQTWALHPMMDTSGSGGGSGFGSSGSDLASGASGWGGSGESAAGSEAGTGASFMEGTVVAEESGTLLLLF